MDESPPNRTMVDDVAAAVACRHLAGGAGDDTITSANAYVARLNVYLFEPQNYL